MKKKNKLNKIISLITLVFTVVLLILISILNIIPMKYFIPILIILLGINLLNILFSFKLRLKKKGKIILTILSIIISLISLIGSFYIFRAITFMDDNFGFKGYSTENYSVIVLKDSNYNEMFDLDRKDLGLLKNKLDDEERLKAYIDDEIDANLIHIDDANTLKEKLYSKEVQAMVIEDSYVEILKEEDIHFESKTKPIYRFSLKYKVEDISKDVNVTRDTFTIYVAGIDTYGNIGSVARSDVNMLVTINPRTHQVLLTSIPRDYYVQLHGTTGYKDKLTHAGMYGVDMSVNTLEDLLGIDINYYLRVNFTSLIKLVDALGGIDVYSEYDFNSNAGYEYSWGYHFSKGYNHVNGEQALVFARTRKAFSGGDRVRGKNQQAVIEAIIRKACSPAILTKYNSILNSLEKSFETNLNMDNITKLARHQIDRMPSWTITSNSLNGSDGMEYTYTFGKQNLYVMYPNEDSVNTAKDLFSKVYNGEILEGSYDGEASNIKNPGNVAAKPKPVVPETPNEENTNNNHESTEESNNNNLEGTTNDGNDALEEHIQDIVGSTEDDINENQ